MIRQQHSQDRYQKDKSNKFMEYISKQMLHSRGSIYDKTRSRNNSRIFPNNNKVKANESFNATEMYSQPQLIKQKRGASILRSNSKTKNRESMTKFRKDFVKDASFNFYDGKQFRQSSSFKNVKDKRVKSTKQRQENLVPGAIGMVFDEQLDVQQIHYQMVKLHQNLKLMQIQRQL